MSDTPAQVQNKINNAEDLKTVVRTMKALAASNIVQYEDAVRALEAYNRNVERALTVCFKQTFGAADNSIAQPSADRPVGIMVLGTDQGLVGQFNEVLAEFVYNRLREIQGEKSVWTVGERIQPHLLDKGITIKKSFNTPGSVAGITILIGELIIDIEAKHFDHEHSLYLFYNQPSSTLVSMYQPGCMQLLPLDSAWQRQFSKRAWPNQQLPEIVGDCPTSLRAFIREYLFVSLYRACAESLSAENSSRLAAMQRAEKNIDQILAELSRRFHQMRQRNIDEELFDVISGYESLPKKNS